MAENVFECRIINEQLRANHTCNFTKKHYVIQIKPVRKILALVQSQVRDGAALARLLREQLWRKFLLSNHAAWQHLINSQKVRLRGKSRFMEEETLAEPDDPVNQKRDLVLDTTLNSLVDHSCY